MKYLPSSLAAPTFDPPEIDTTRRRRFFIFIPVKKDSLHYLKTKQKKASKDKNEDRAGSFIFTIWVQLEVVLKPTYISDSHKGF
jgi:hypothetical protein